MADGVDLEATLDAKSAELHRVQQLLRSTEATLKKTKTSLSRIEDKLARCQHSERAALQRAAALEHRVRELEAGPESSAQPRSSSTPPPASTPPPKPAHLGVVQASTSDADAFWRSTAFCVVGSYKGRLALEQAYYDGLLAIVARHRPPASVEEVSASDPLHTVAAGSVRRATKTSDARLEVVRLTEELSAATSSAGRYRGELRAARERNRQLEEELKTVYRKVIGAREAMVEEVEHCQRQAAQPDRRAAFQEWQAEQLRTRVRDLEAIMHRQSSSLAVTERQLAQHSTTTPRRSASSVIRGRRSGARL